MAGERPLRIRGTVTLMATDSKTGELLFKTVQHNLVMQTSLTGLDLVIQWIIGGMAPLGAAAAFVNGVNYGEIGTGTTPVTINDTGNQTPTVRVIPSLQNDIAQSQAVLQFYFPDASLPNGTYTEFATFVNGSGTLASGNIFNHALFGTAYAKSSGMDTTVQVTFTLSQ